QAVAAADSPHRTRPRQRCMIWWSRRRVQIREPSTWPKAITHRHRPAPGSLRRRAALRCAVMLVTDPPERPVRWQGGSGEDLAGDGGVGRVEAVQVFRRTACRGSRDKAKLAVAVLSGDVGNGQESAMAYRPGSRR